MIDRDDRQSPLEESQLDRVRQQILIAATAGDSNTTVTVTAVIERIKDAQTGKWSCRILEWVSG